MKRLLLAVVALLSLLVACSPLAFVDPPTPTPLLITPVFYPTDTPTPVPDPIYLSIIWTFHQPLYTTDPQTGLITKPWVRVYGTRQYYTAAELLQKYPKVHATYNFSPVLIKQINDLLAGARDQYWELSTIPASSLSDDDKRFMLAHFFDAPQGFIASNVRYKELLDLRGGAGDADLSMAIHSFSEQDLRDLQVWYLLACFGTPQLSEPPLSNFVAQGRNFSEDDKHAVMSVALDELSSLFKTYSRMQTNGQIELSVSPYAQPILPLILDSNQAKVDQPKANLPEPAFSSAKDVSEQLQRAWTSYQRSFGTNPRGLIPTGGAVSPSLVQPIISDGYQWTVSGEDVLAKALGQASFKRDAQGRIQDADALYRPYAVHTNDGSSLVVFFRDDTLSSLFTTQYSKLAPDAAAGDLVNRLLAIQAGLRKARASGPHLVTIVLDGESTWAGYPDGGSAFIQALYQRLTQAAELNQIQTVTPSEYDALFTSQRSLKSLPAGSWGEPGDFSQWIGSSEENASWSNLARTRSFLEDYLTGAKLADPIALQKAYDAMLLAESADWMQWRSNNQPDISRSYYDSAFRALLSQVYMLVGVPKPDYLQIPILPTSIISGSRMVSAVMTPTIDGIATNGEWNAAGVVRFDGTPALGSAVDAFYYGANNDSLFFRVDAQSDWSVLGNGMDTPQPIRVGIYFSRPGDPNMSAFTRVAGDSEVRYALDMSATHLLEWTLETDGSASALLYAATAAGGWSGTSVVSARGAAVGKVLELAAPLKALGALPSHAALTMEVVVMRGGHVISTFPAGNLVQMVLPTSPAKVSAMKVLGSFDDPPGDDHGPGTYTYPTDSVFKKGTFDLKHVTIAEDAKTLVFQIDMAAPIDNAWNSPIGLSLQTFDIYIDKDPGKGNGERKLLEGRNASLPRNDDWEYALSVEGWSQLLFTPDGKGGVTAHPDVPVKVEVDPSGTVIIRVPLDSLGNGNPIDWAYAIAVLGQDANPSQGVRRVRDVDTTASQWHFGGAPNDTNHTRIIDALVPPGASLEQEIALGKYPASHDTNTSKLSVDDFGILPMVTMGQ